MQIRIYVTRKGVQKVLLVNSKKKATIDSLAFYSKIEPEIEEFKKAVRRAISASPGKSTRGASFK